MTRYSRAPFLVAIAIVAAALADPLVESVTNAGVFGYRQADNNHMGIIPALLAGSVLLLEVAVMRFMECWRRTTAGERDWLPVIADRFAHRSCARDAPLIFSMQIAALFVMESVEQLASSGSLAGVLVWLGGPLWFSLLVHALVCTACTFTFAWSMRAVLRTFAFIVLRALSNAIAIGAAPRVTYACRGRGAMALERFLPQLARVSGRAPPSSRDGFGLIPIM